MRIVIACAGFFGIALLMFAGLGVLIIDAHQSNAIVWVHASAFAGLTIFVIAAIALHAITGAGK